MAGGHRQNNNNDKQNDNTDSYTGITRVNTGNNNNNNNNHNNSNSNSNNNNNDNEMTDQPATTTTGESNTNTLLHKQMDLYLGLPLSILGVIFNIVTVVVWRRVNKHREGAGRSIGVFLMMFAVVNVFLLLSYVACEVSR